MPLSKQRPGDQLLGVAGIRKVQGPVFSKHSGNASQINEQTKCEFLIS